MTARRGRVIALVVALALPVASPAVAGPLGRAARFTLRQAVRFIEARQAIARARDLRERLREAVIPAATWRSVAAAGSSTAPQSPRTTPELRPRGRSTMLRIVRLFVLVAVLGIFVPALAPPCARAASVTPQMDLTIPRPIARPVLKWLKDNWKVLYIAFDELIDDLNGCGCGDPPPPPPPEPLEPYPALGPQAESN